jgi:hypothetical protein
MEALEEYKRIQRNLRSYFHHSYTAYKKWLAAGNTEKAARHLANANMYLEEGRKHRATRPATARRYGGVFTPHCLRTEKDFRPNKPPAAPRPARRPPPAAARPLVQKKEWPVQEPPSLTVSFL